MNIIKDFLTHKGWITTILGAFIGFPVGTAMIIKYFTNPEFTQGELLTTCVIQALAMMFVILPSKVLIETKIGKIEVTD